MIFPLLRLIFQREMCSNVFKTILFDAMQHLALYNFNISYSAPPPQKKEICVAPSFISGKVSAQVSLDIFQMRSCAVQSSVAMASLIWYSILLSL